MNYDIKDNTGKAFINNFRTTESRPHFKGKLKVDGVVKDVSIWKKFISSMLKLQREFVRR